MTCLKFLAVVGFAAVLAGCENPRPRVQAIGEGSRWWVGVGLVFGGTNAAVEAQDADYRLGQDCSGGRSTGGSAGAGSCSSCSSHR